MGNKKPEKKKYEELDEVVEEIISKDPSQKAKLVLLKGRAGLETRMLNTLFGTPDGEEEELVRFEELTPQEIKELIDLTPLSEFVSELPALKRVAFVFQLRDLIRELAKPGGEELLPEHYKDFEHTFSDLKDVFLAINDAITDLK